MSWQDDKQRKLDTESARQVREQLTAERKATAKRLYEQDVTIDDITRRARCGQDTIRKWAREGGWKRGQG